MIIPKNIRKVRNTLAPLSLRDFYEKRNKILVISDTGGAGDILMHRMIFEDMKKTHPDLEIHFAVPLAYFDLACGHPYIDKVVNARVIDENEYIVTYKTTTCCTRYEYSNAPLVDKHRSDIWANHCGIELTNHNMHLSVPPEAQKKANERVEKYRKNGKPVVCFCPISAGVQKDLDRWQSNNFLKLVDSKFNVFALHYSELSWLMCPTEWNMGVWEWIGVLNAADYIVSVDTGSFHAANGLNKPTVGIFTWVDGEIYGKYHPKFVLVQKHRKHTPGWTCGPCYDWPQCPRVHPDNKRKPCITELTGDEIAQGLFKLAERYPVS